MVGDPQSSITPHPSPVCNTLGPSLPNPKASAGTTAASHDLWASPAGSPPAARLALAPLAGL